MKENKASNYQSEAKLGRIAPWLVKHTTCPKRERRRGGGGASKRFGKHPKILGRVNIKELIKGECSDQQTK